MKERKGNKEIFYHSFSLLINEGRYHDITCEKKFLIRHSLERIKIQSQCSQNLQKKFKARNCPMKNEVQAQLNFKKKKISSESLDKIKPEPEFSDRKFQRARASERSRLVETSTIYHKFGPLSGILCPILPVRQILAPD